MSIDNKTKKKAIGKDAALVRTEQVLADPAVVGIDLVNEYQVLAEEYRKRDHTLHKTLPICMVCHKIRTPNEYWERLDEYLASHADILLSHGICPDCVKQTYGQLGEKMLVKQKVAEELKHPEKIQVPQEDGALEEMRALVKCAISGNNPLTPDIEKIVKNYTKLLRRFDKIVSLSDSYQSQLRGFNLRLELMAHTDPLTGINNRGHFIELLGVELERASRYGRQFSVLMLDLDNFKQVNDTRGHAAGDEALKSVSRVLKASGLRNSDFFGRIGGEEFALVFPETGMQGAAEAAERVRANLEKSAIIHDGQKFFITASIGISEYRSGDTRETLLNRADKAMYRAKESGRNRICLDL